MCSFTINGKHAARTLAEQRALETYIRIYWPVKNDVASNFTTHSPFSPATSSRVSKNSSANSECAERDDSFSGFRMKGSESHSHVISANWLPTGIIGREWDRFSKKFKNGWLELQCLFPVSDYARSAPFGHVLRRR